ncbi:MAG: hypothetical protein KBD31_00015 [Proteobacteria bacterium]|nr:hypothetical protein [Pseudomonadota bacterium]
MSKLNPDTSNKFSTVETPVLKQTTTKIPDKIISKKISRTSSFSLRKKDKERLFDILEKVNNMTEKKVTSTDVLRGLLISGINMSNEDLLSCVQKSFME